ncbi:MAG: helix-turn-helix domain-containing protein [Paludibacter sp.]|nr:helix-turn-helix domain-containing protein [Paludibacter sp.]
MRFDAVYKFANIAVYPLYFLYIVYLTREVNFRPAYLLVLLPAFLVSSTTQVVYMLMGNEEALNFVHQVVYREESAIQLSNYGRVQLLVHRLTSVIFTVQLVLVSIVGSRLLVQFDEKVRNYYADTEGRNLLWTRRLFLTFAVISVFSIIANVLGRAFFLPFDMIMVPSAVFSVLVFAIGYISYDQRFTVQNLHNDSNAPTFEEELFDENEVEFVYTNSQSAELKNKLQSLVEDEKIYTRKDLRIVDLSKIMNTNRTYVSRLINQEYGKSFSELINHFRFEEAKRMLLRNEYSFLSISEIANRAGFPSESSFYRVFKKETGMAPGDWRKLNG